MTKTEAIRIVCDMAGRWGENAEEGCARRILPEDTDEACIGLAEPEGFPGPEDVIEIRDLWRAIDLLRKDLMA
jgi:hypothetical protein